MRRTTASGCTESGLIVRLSVDRLVELGDEREVGKDGSTPLA
jgi:hypothetical protein